MRKLRDTLSNKLWHAIKRCISNFAMHANHLREIVKAQILIQKVWSRVGVCTFLKSSHVRLRLMLLGPHFFFNVVREWRNLSSRFDFIITHNACNLCFSYLLYCCYKSSHILSGTRKDIKKWENIKLPKI